MNTNTHEYGQAFSSKNFTTLFFLLVTFLLAFAPLVAVQAQDADDEEETTGITDAGEKELFMMEEIIVTGTASQGRTKFDSSVGISTFNADDIAKQAPASIGA